MIEGSRELGYELGCDNCQEIAEETFDTWQEAKEFKCDKDNGWRAVKDTNDDWNDLCPSCTTPEIIRKLRGQ